MSRIGKKPVNLPKGVTVNVGFRQRGKRERPSRRVVPGH
jgi:ribosomal protein L6P/L9E